MENKLQDSGRDYLGVQSIDLQTSRPASCTLQCESRKLALRQRRERDPNCNGCICRAGSSFLLGEVPRARALGAASARHCRLSRVGRALGAPRGPPARVPGAPALDHHMPSPAGSLGTTTNSF